MRSGLQVYIGVSPAVKVHLTNSAAPFAKISHRDISARVTEPSGLDSFAANLKSLKILCLCASRATSSYLPFCRFLGSANASESDISPGSHFAGSAFETKVAATFPSGLRNSYASS